MLFLMFKLFMASDFLVYSTEGYLLKNKIKLANSIRSYDEIHSVSLQLYNHKEIVPWEVKGLVLNMQTNNGKDIFYFDLFFKYNDITDLYNKYSTHFIKVKYNVYQHENFDYEYIEKIIELKLTKRDNFMIQQSSTSILHQFLMCEFSNLVHIFLFREKIEAVKNDLELEELEFLQDLINCYSEKIADGETDKVLEYFVKKFIENEEKKQITEIQVSACRTFMNLKIKIYKRLNYTYTDSLIEMDKVNQKTTILRRGLLVRIKETINIQDSNIHVEYFTENGKFVEIKCHTIYNNAIFILHESLIKHKIVYFVVCHKSQTGKIRRSNRIYIKQ